MIPSSDTITVNQPFDSLEPLTTYLDVLQWVTEGPSDAALDRLQIVDTVLTARAVLFPRKEYVHNEGYRIFGYEPCTISRGVEAVARRMLQGSVEPERPSEPVHPLDALQQEKASRSCRNESHAALITLGGHLAVSGAFIEREILPAYWAIRGSMDVIGGHDDDFTAFGLGHIMKDLLGEYRHLQRGSAMRNPIGKAEAKGNIKSAWQVVGRPYGRLTSLILALST